MKLYHLSKIRFKFVRIFPPRRLRSILLTFRKLAAISALPSGQKSLSKFKPYFRHMVLLKFLLALLAFCGVERFCQKKTHGFRLHKIASEETIYESYLPEGEEKETLQKMVNQPYRFLSSGGESYVFVSRDDRYVIKFFKHHHMRKRSLFDLFNSEWKGQRMKKRDQLFASCRIAEERLKEETGLIALHLAKTPGYFDRPLTILDPLNVAHTINLDQTDFALQHKGELAMDLLKRSKDPQLLDAIIALIHRRSSKGVADLDSVFKRNLAFIDKRAIAIDLGAFAIDEGLKTPFLANRALFFETLKLRRWLSKNAPELLPYFEERLNQNLQTQV